MVSVLLRRAARPLSALVVLLSLTVATPATASAQNTPTLFGFAVSVHGSETYAQALSRQSAALGAPKVIRYFFGPRALEWPVNRGATGTTPLVASFSRNPSAVVRGEHDAEIRTWLAKLPTDRPTYVSYEHEMDAKVAQGVYAAEVVKAANIRVSGLISAQKNPMIKKTLILTGWDYENRMKTFYPGSAHVDVLGVDPYQWNTETVNFLFDNAIRIAAAHGKPLGIAEFGVRSGTDAQRAAFIKSAVDYTRGKVAFFTYFNVDKSAYAGDYDWEIHDLPLSSATYRAATALATPTPTPTPTPTAPAVSPIAFRAATTAQVNAATASIVVPSATRPGDVLVLAASYGVGQVSPTAPAGWAVAGQGTAGSGSNAMRTIAWTRTAGASDAGKTVVVSSGGASYVKTTLVLSAYSGVNTVSPVAGFAASSDANVAVHQGAAVASAKGQWAIQIWSDKSSSTTTWQPTSGSTRAQVLNSGRGRTSMLMADSGGALAAGTFKAGPASTNAPSALGIHLTLMLRAS